jgi:hypothetical protein
MPSATPAHDLDTIKRLAVGAGVVFNARKSTEIVADLLSLTPPQSRAFVVALLASLTTENYAHTLAEKVPAADVYGVFARGWGWYLKVTLSGHLLVISCHPVEAPLRTRCETITTRLL